jgi:hypothetical protein
MTSITPGGLLVIALLSSVVASCGRNPSAPTDAPGTGGATLTLSGRIVDDLDEPVQVVTVTAHPEYVVNQRTPSQVTTDADGAFSMVVQVRPDHGLDGVPVLLDRAGYEGTEVWVSAGSRETITMYPTTMLATNSTLETRLVESAPYACGHESAGCRRIRLLPAQRAIEVTIVAAAGETVGLVDNDPPLAPYEYASTVTTADGDVFIIGGPASVTLRARYAGSADPLTGQYSLTLVHDCQAVPEGARTRRYTATIDSDLIVTLSDAQFSFDNGCVTMDALRLGCHQFLASREQDNVRFDLLNDHEWHGGYITERVPAGTWLQVFGSTSGRLEGGNVTASGTGGVWYCPANQDLPFPCLTSTGCENVNLQMTFVRR